MKRLVLFLIVALGFVSFLIAMRPQAENYDARVLVKLDLQSMAEDINNYFRISDASDWQTTCQLKNINEVRTSLKRKISLVRDGREDFVDIWGDPYLFEVAGTEKTTVIRIISKGHGTTPLFVELEFDAARKVIRQKVSWNSTVLAIDVPAKNDGWIVKPVPK